MQKKIFHTILVIVFSDFLMFQQILLTLQVKPIVIVTNKHSIYEFLHEMLKDLKLTILEN